MKKLCRNCPNDRVRTQAARALANLGTDEGEDTHNEGKYEEEKG